METRIVKQLSGEEVKAAILYQIDEALSNDDRLNAHVAYGGFAFSATLQIRTPNSWNAGFDRVVEGQGGEPEFGSLTESMVIETTVDDRSPNETRVETDQPVPVLVTDERTGKTSEKYISYSDKPKQKVGRPRKA